ncbi:MAG: OmpA family protein [Deltaproteobacteria bacterium]|nr:OmpA family protein [Deltaproteobacteria bacterium]
MNEIRRCTSIAVVVGVLLFTISAAADKKVVRDGEGMAVRLFRPAVDTKGHFTTDGSNVLPHLNWSIGMTLDFGFNHWIAVEQEGEFFDKTLMDKAINAKLIANLGLINMFVVGLQLPIGVSGGTAFAGENMQGERVDEEWSTKGAFGDIGIHAKAAWLKSSRYPIGLGTIIQYEFGSGQSELLLGEPGNSGTLSGKMIVDSEPARWYRVALNVGGRYSFGAQDENWLSDEFILDDDYFLFKYGMLLNAGLGQSFNLWRDVIDFVVEVYGNQLGSEFGNMKYLSVEANAGFKIYVDGHSYLMAGAAAGLPISDTESKYGFQNAQWRMFLGIAFEPSIGDKDRDGVPDDIDQCLDEKEDWDGFEDTDGCPDPDNDKDGILDVDDDCPLIPEDRDGDEDEDGCPEHEEVPELNDRDKDGILDEEDECPDDPEDRDGFEDADGCPDPDNDRDGFPDVNDECPTASEVLNGFEDEDGCPDEGEALVTVTDDQFQLLEGIRFKSASHEIVGQKSFEILDAVAAVLRANPDLRVRIEGHTDSRGRRRYNIDLSKRRAKSVKKYLVENDIDASRLEPKGYGPDQPIDTNETEEGRHINRRVMFKKIK